MLQQPPVKAFWIISGTKLSRVVYIKYIYIYKLPGLNEDMVEDNLEHTFWELTELQMARKIRIPCLSHQNF